jgi:hypothetical protein
MKKIKNIKMIVITTVIPKIIQFTLLSFLLVSFIYFRVFGAVKLDDQLPKSGQNHIKKEGQAYRMRAILPKYEAKKVFRKMRNSPSF